jgi:uncharacterized protein YhjY with autotransporter beta-barrel domain/phospholipase/lecithinase/hemolysin
MIMNRFASRLLAGVAVTAGAMSLAAPAEAQRVNRIVALGDSYIDDGNVFELTGTARPAVYPLGRFSNGTNLVDTLGQILDAPILNYGIGGAVARAQNTTIPQVQAFDLQVQSFLAGGGPAAFPRSSGRFAPDDLLIVNIGANDARAYQFSFGRTPTAAQIATLQAGVPAQAQLAAGDAIRNLNALVAAGARNLTVLGGDVGGLPEVAGQPVAAVGSAYSNAYNGLVRQALAGYANNGAIVNYLDLTRIQQVAAANLAAFNLTSIGACPMTCVTTNPELLDRYLVYVDQLHLTQRGYEIVGQYAARQLEAPLHLEAQGEAVLGSAGAFGRALGDRLQFDTSGEGPPFRVFISGDYGQVKREDTATSLAYRLERWAGLAGVEYERGPFMAGLAGSLSRGEADMRTGTGNVDVDALHLGVYAQWDIGSAFVEGYAGIGRAELDIRRRAVIDEISASPEADTLTAGGRAGYLFGFGRLRVGPFVGLDYARAEIEAYTETGDQVLTLNVEDQEADRLLGSVGVELRADLDMGGNSIRPYLMVAAEQELEEEARFVRYAGTAAPEIVNRWTIDPGSSDPHAKIAGGVDLGLTNRFTLQITGATTVGQDGGDESSASVALRFGF